jgi:hypothetical protein
MILERNGSKKPAPQETTLEGRVEILGDFPRGTWGESSSVKHSGLLLRTERGRVIILLGPVGYFMEHNFQIKAGDTLEVTGVKVLQEQVPIIQAREIKNQQQHLKLRDSNGLPLWPAVPGQRPLH